MLIPGCSYSYKNQAGKCKTPEETHRAMEECGCVRCQNGLGEPELGVRAREEAKALELPAHVLWRGRILDRIPPKDSMDYIARYQHGHWLLWTEHLPDQKIEHKWHASWGYRESPGADSSLGYAHNADPMKALEECLRGTRSGLRTTMSTVAALANRMNVLSAVIVSATADLDALEKT